MSIAKLKNKYADGAWVKNVKDFFTKINEIIDHLNSTTPVTTKECTIFLESQNGTSNPVYTILSNTLDETPVITRDDVGIYFVTAVGCFTEFKTICSCDNQSGDTFGKITMTRASNDLVTVITNSAADAASDDMMLNNWIRITVYP